MSIARMRAAFPVAPPPGCRRRDPAACPGHRWHLCLDRDAAKLAGASAASSGFAPTSWRHAMPAAAKRCLACTRAASSAASLENAGVLIDVERSGRAPPGRSAGTPQPERAFARTCSTDVAPATTETTCGCAASPRSQRRAARCRARWHRLRDLRRCRVGGVSHRLGLPRAPRRDGCPDRGRPRRCLPVSRPLRAAVRDHPDVEVRTRGITPSPRPMQRLYSFCR